jgi:hypothetical protein
MVAVACSLLEEPKFVDGFASSTRASAKGEKVSVVTSAGALTWIVRLSVAVAPEVSVTRRVTVCVPGSR